METIPVYQEAIAIRDILVQLGLGNDNCAIGQGDGIVFVQLTHSSRKIIIPAGTAIVPDSDFGRSMTVYIEEYNKLNQVDRENLFHGTNACKNKVNILMNLTLAGVEFNIPS